MKKYTILEQSENQVKEVQSKLNSCFNAGLNVDGKLGPKTADAIMKYIGLNIRKKIETIY